MSVLRLEMFLALAVAATLGSGCLDDGGGPQDQWMNTDAYVGPEVSTSSGDGGVSCGDATVFGAPARLSEDREPDGGVVHPQYDVTMAGAAAGTRYVAWVDRDLSLTDDADVLVAAAPASGTAATPTVVPRPLDCNLLLEPALAVTAAGTVALAVTCVQGYEGAPTLSQILLFRSLDGLQTWAAPTVVASCGGDVLDCGTPAIAAAPGGALWVAWTELDLLDGFLVGARSRVARSDDDGATLAGEAAIASTFGETALPHLAVDPNDGVHLVFSGAFSLGGTFYTAYAALEGSGDFGEPEVLGPGFEARVTATADGVFVVWVAGLNILQEAHAVGGGFTPAAPVGQPAGTTEVLTPAVAGGPDGTVHVFWQAFDDSVWRVYYSASADLGASWQSPLLVGGPFDGDPTGALSMAHLIGRVDLVADDYDVTLGWADSAATDPMSGVSNVYLARRLCP